MDTERWESVKDLLLQALQLTPAERPPFLDEACSSDQALRAELESLLHAEEKVRASFLESPPLAGALVDADLFATGSGTGLQESQIFAQRFRLVRKLGEGGMGQVWLAEQTSPIQRQVALKLIKAGMYDASVVQRFRAERQSLAIMDHPAIAKVFDAGATEQGQPYFVMEYVPGLAITDYCDRNKLPIWQRLNLFIEVCEGVQHAHQKAVIHRDLKPANILVVEVGGKPAPRIIDFGLAKAAAPRADDGTLLTQQGSFVGTPAYMSPEQADPEAPDIDTRSDVYSLGVVLYELLTGTLPIDMKQWPKQPLEVLQKLREEDPDRPSTKVSADRQTSTTAAEARSTVPAHLASLLRGDLDWIAMKALEKDRARRYGTPSELAGDIRRYLNQEPIVARPASVGYRIQKYVRRHRVAVGVAAVLVLLLAGFAGLEAVQLRRISRERDRANQERDRANRERGRATRITDFMTNMFKVPEPSVARGNSVTAREILDRASNDITTNLAKDPDAQSQMMQVMANTYQNLSLNDRAYDLAKRALETRMTRLGPEDPTTMESMDQLGRVLLAQGHYAEGEKLLRQAVSSEQRVLGADNELTLGTTDTLALARGYEGDYAEEEKMEREVVDAGTRKLGPENSEVLRAKHNLGVALWRQARYPEAEQVFTEVVEARRRLSGSDAPGTLNAMGVLALIRADRGQVAEAESLYREILVAQERVQGIENQGTAFTMENLSSLLIDEGRFAEAEKLSRTAMGVRMRLLGPEHHDTLVSKVNLSIALMKQGHVKEAEKLQREAVASQIRLQGPGGPNTLQMQTYLAETLIKERRYAEGERIARTTYEAQVSLVGLQHPDTVDTLRQLGRVLALTHRYGEANKLFRDTIEKDTNSSMNGNHFQLWYAYACVAAVGNRQGDALQYLQEAVNRGYKDPVGLLADDDLKSLRPNPRLQEIVAQLRQKQLGGK